MAKRSHFTCNSSALLELAITPITPCDMGLFCNLLAFAQPSLAASAFSHSKAYDNIPNINRIVCPLLVNLTPRLGIHTPKLQPVLSAHNLMQHCHENILYRNNDQSYLIKVIVIENECLPTVTKSKACLFA